MKQIRNLAIIAHVDHGKTTLVDEILKQSKIFRDNQQVKECFLDSNDLERERGITILSKNISVVYKNVKINLIDTPGHSDFGGQVERVLKLADGVLLLVDAAEGPMPQSRFVLDKALQLGLKVLVMINKVDKPDARCEEVHDEILELFFDLDAGEDQLDFPLLYGSGRNGWASPSLDGDRSSILPLMDAVLEHVPPPVRREGPAQMQIATLDYSDYVGRICIGRVFRGTFSKNRPLALIKGDSTVPVQIKQLFTFEGLERSECNSVPCGDICAVVGLENADIGDTVADAEKPEALERIAIDEPTISMVFRVNDSPLYGREGKFVSSRHLRERLFKEIERDVALKVRELSGLLEAFEVSGRGVLHLAILIENMRREGYEFAVSRPHVICKNVDGVRQEPIEILTIEVPDEYSGKMIELAGLCKGEMHRMETRGARKLLEFEIPTRGLIGFRSKALTGSAGEAIIAHRFLRYGPFRGEVQRRINGVLVSMGQGKAVAYAIDALQLRGEFFIDPNTETYEGMIVAENCKEGDLTVNLQKGKQLTNMRASGSDRAMKIAPARKMSLEQCLEYIEDDELLEVTPQSLRMRKLYLTELERKRNRQQQSV